MRKIIDYLMPKVTRVEILTPDQKFWVIDKAKPVPIDGMSNERGFAERLMVLSKRGVTLPRFKPDYYKTMFGLKEVYKLYTPDWENFQPLHTKIDGHKFKLEPEDYNHSFLKGLVKTHIVTRFKKEDLWKTYLPIITVVILIVATAVWQKAVLSEQQALAAIWSNAQGSVADIANKAGSSPIPKPPTP